MQPVPDEDRTQGFVRPLRSTYIHRCGASTHIPLDLAQRFAANPAGFTHTFCSHCQKSFPVAEFGWKDGDVVGT